MLQVLQNFKLQTNFKLKQCPTRIRFASIPPPITSPQIKFKGIFINNEFVKSTNGFVFETINPANGKAIAEIQCSGVHDVEKAVTAAKEAFKLGSPWRTLDASKRGLLIGRLAELIARDRHYLASLETLDNGKPYAVAYQGDLPFAVKLLKYFAGWADKNHGKTIPMDGNYFAYTRHEPIGVCAQIIPWNFPIAMVAMKLGPALATGNTVILKPAEQTPLTALYIASLVKEAGFPPGVVNILPGFGTTGAILAKHCQIDKISFTGSTRVGKLIQQSSGLTNLKRITLELGGKSPIIVLNDVDLEQAVETSHFGIFFNMGQCCCAAARTYVHSSIYEKFVELSVARAKRICIGDPFDLGVELGPLIDGKQLWKVLKMIESGKKEGAKLLTGGQKIEHLPGCFIQPTVFSDVTDSMQFTKEEIFGPVQQILCFSDIDEVIERANQSTYGLAAGILTNDLNKAKYLIQALRAGTVWVNSYNVLAPQIPFGGYKMSGFGRENGEYALENYTAVKSVIIKLCQKNS